ncbi:hypothetical protein ABPG74_017209 [Tetrahymena malaccensis]
MPQSALYFNNTNIRNIYNKSPYSIVYINADIVLLDLSNFDRNTYEYNHIISFQNKGYLSLRFNLCNITNNIFQNSISKDGSSINIYQNEAGSQLFIQNCTFKNLISQSGGGGALLVQQSTYNSFMILKGCIFQNILSKDGGAIKQINSQMAQSSLIGLDECQIVNSISQNEGSFITSQNVLINIKYTNLTANFPLNNQDLDQQQLGFLSTFQTIGSVFYITQSNLDLNYFNLFNYNISYYNISSVSNPTFLYSFTSSISVDNSNFTNSTFNQAGFFEIYSSFANINNSLFDNLKYYDETQRKYNKDDIMQRFINSDPEFLTIERETGYVKSSMILIKQNSQFQIQNNNFTSISCFSQSNCFGSALGIIQSSGNIQKSVFIGCISFNNGGAVSIQSAFSQIKINSCYFEDNISLQKGGAIYLSQLTNSIIIEYTSIISNIASYGGALFQFQDIQSNITKNISNINITLNDCAVLKNYASQFGSGLYVNTFITKQQGNNKISNNSPGQNFGINFFYQPAMLHLNLRQTQLLNQNQTVDIQYFSQNFTFKVNNQVSGYQIPALVFELHDLEGNQITDQYAKAQQIYMQLNLQKQIDNIDQQLFFLILPNENIQFSENQFILREITIEGIPENTIQLLLTLQIYQANKLIDKQQFPGFPQYYLQIELRKCLQGEILIPKKLLIQNQIFKVYECSKCKEGSYSLVVPNLNDEPLAQCNKCQEMMTCLGGDEIYLNQGYWRQNKSTDSVYLCLNNPKSCLGGMSENVCEKGYIGPLCEECDLKQGYHKSGKFQCIKMQDMKEKLLISILIIAFLSYFSQVIINSFIQLKLVFRYLNKNRDITFLIKSNLLPIFKNLIHYASILQIILNLGYQMPSQFSTFLMVVLSPIQYIIQIFQPFFYQQVEETNILSLIYFNYLLKISVYAFIYIILLLYGLIKYRKIHLLKQHFFYNSFYFIYLAFQPTIIRDSLNLIMCRKINNQNFIQENLLYKCFTDEYTKFTYKLLWPILFVFAIILPLVLFIVTKKNLKQIKKSKMNYFMTYQYKQSYWFWEWVKLILRSLFLITEQFLQDDYINSSLVIIILLCCYGYFLKKALPNSYSLHNQIEFLFLMGTVICIYVSLFLKLNEENQTIIKICLSIIFSDFFSLALLITYLIIQDSKQNMPTQFLYLKIWAYKCLCQNNLIFSLQKRKTLKLKIFFLSYLSYMKQQGYLSTWTGKSHMKLKACIFGSDLELQMITKSNKLIKKSKFKTGEKCQTQYIDDQVIQAAPSCPTFKQLGLHSGFITSLYYLKDSNLFIAIDHTFTLFIFNLQDGSLLQRYQRQFLNGDRVKQLMLINDLDLYQISNLGISIIDVLNGNQTTQYSNLADYYENMYMFSTKTIDNQLNCEYAIFVRNAYQNSRIIIFGNVYNKFQTFYDVKPFRQDTQSPIDSSLLPKSYFYIDNIKVNDIIVNANLFVALSTQQFIFCQLLTFNSYNIVTWYPKQLNYAFKYSFVLSSQMVLIIQFGQAIDFNGDSSLQNCLCIFDLTLLQISNDNALNLDLTLMLKNPILCQKLSTILQVNSIIVANPNLLDEYLLWSLNNNQTVITQSKQVRNQNFMQNFNYSSFPLQRNANNRYLYIPQTPFLLMSSLPDRKIYLFNLTQQLSMNQDAGQIQSLYSISGFYQPSTIVSAKFNPNTLQFNNIAISGSGLVFQNSFNIITFINQFEGFNLTSFQLYYHLAVDYKFNYFVGYQTNYYVLASNINSCEKLDISTIGNQITYQARISQLIISQGKQLISVDLQLEQINQIATQILFMDSFQINNSKIVIFLIQTKQFIFSQYCQVQNPSSINIQVRNDNNRKNNMIMQLYILDQKIAQLDLSQYTDQNEIYQSLSYDSQGTIFISLSQKIIVVNYFSDQTFKQQQILLIQIQDLLIQLQRLQNSIIQNLEINDIFIIPQTNNFLLSFKDRQYQYLCFGQYNQQWYLSSQSPYQINFQIKNCYSSQSKQDFTIFNADQYIYLAPTNVLIFILKDQMNIFTFNSDDFTIDLKLSLKNQYLNSFVFPYQGTDQSNPQFNQIIQIQNNFQFGIINFDDCIQKNCNNMCAIKKIYQKNQNNAFSNLIDWNQKDIQSNIFQAKDSMKQMNQTHIIYQITMEKETLLQWKPLYMNFTNLISTYYNTQFSLVIKSEIQNNQQSQQINQRAILQTSYPLQIYNYIFLYFKDLVLKIDQNSFQDQSLDVVNLILKQATLDNIQFATKQNKELEIGKSSNGFTQINESYLKINVLQADKIILKNMVIKNQYFTTASYFIKVQTDYLVVDIQNMLIDSSTFVNRMFINSQKYLKIVGDNITISNSIFLNQMQSIYFFMQASSLQLQNYNFYQNTVSEMLIIGCVQFDNESIYNIKNIKIVNNTFIKRTQTPQLFLSQQFISNQNNQTSMQLYEGVFKNNSLVYSDLRNISSQQIIDFNSQVIQNYLLNPKSLIQTQDFFMFTNQNIFQVEYSSINNHDNQILSLINIQESSNSVINNYNCTNSNLDIIIQNDGSCAKIISQKHLNFNLTNIFISNKSSLNSYILEFQEKSIMSMQQSPQLKIEQYIYLSNITVNNIYLQSLTQFDQVSLMFIHHNQNALISIRDFNFTNVKISTSQTQFIEYGVLFYIQSPTSLIQIQDIFIKNVDSNSPYSLIMSNSKQISIYDSIFSGINNLNQNNLSRGAGFLKILSQNITIQNCTFEKGRFQVGGAVNIILNDQIQLLNIQSCKFEDFVTMQSGASIFFQNEAFQLEAQLTNVTFNQTYALSQGGAVYIKGSSQIQLLGSNIIFYNNSIIDAYAFQSGSFIFANLIQLVIQNSTITQNNPSKIIEFQKFNQLEDLFCQMGSMIEIISSQLSIQNSIIQNLKSVVSIPCKPLIILSQSYSNITLSQTQINNIIQDFNGLITIKQSFLKIVGSTFKQIQDKKAKDSDYFGDQESISSIIKSEFGIQKNSAINILQQSYYFFDSSIFQNMRCQYDDFCYAGVAVVQDSGGKIINSSFDQNYSKNNGGAISIINLQFLSEIQSSNFTNNEALKSGGAIYIQRNLGKIKMSIDQCIISGNSAFSGGGLYLDVAQTNKTFIQDLSIKETKISQNLAKLAGGGVTYLVKIPYFLKTKIEGNQAIQNYGKNLFSGPVRMQLNWEKTLQCNSKNSINQNIFMKSQSLSSVTYSIHDQVSGQDLPCLIFSYIDENGYEINETYNQFSNTLAQLTLYKHISGNIDYNIISNQRVFQYQGYFNISNVRIQGTPNSTLLLNFTSNQLQYQGEQTYYTLFLEVNLRQCKKGEIMVEIASKQKGYQNIYECFQCAEGEQIFFKNKIYKQNNQNYRYSLIQPNVDNYGECKKCSPYAICEGGDKITIKPGYWRSSDQSDSIQFCINNPLNCLGGKQNNTCEVGHIGPLCEECDSDQGYVQYGKLQCFQCESTKINIIKILFLLVFFEKVSSNSLCRGNLYIYNISESTIQDNFSTQQLRSFPYIPSKQISRTVINQSNFAQQQAQKDCQKDPPNSPN